MLQIVWLCVIGLRLQEQNFSDRRHNVLGEAGVEGWTPGVDRVGGCLSAMLSRFH